MVTLRDNPHFKIYGYWPGTPSQWREPTVDDCTWYAGEFAFEAADNQHRSFHPVKDIRNDSSDRVGGTPVEVMLRDMAAWWPKDGDVQFRYAPLPLGEIERALTSGATVVVGGDYEKLPLHYRRWTINDKFDHAIALRFYDPEKGRTAMYDPLGGGPTYQYYDGEYIQLTRIFGDYDDFAWQHQAGLYWVGIVDNRKRAEILRRLYVDPADVKKYVRVKKGTPVYKYPSTTSDMLKRWWHEDKEYDLVGRVDAQWYMVYMWDAELKVKILAYITKQDIVAMGDKPNPVFPPDSEKDILITQLQSELDFARAQVNDLNGALDNIVQNHVPLAQAIEDAGESPE